MSVIDKIKLDGTTYDVGKTPDTTLAVSGSPADAAKVGTELDKKVDKVTGKGLSTEDYTTAEKTKLAGLTQIEVDDTLSVEGRAADAKEAGDKINELKNGLANNIAFINDPTTPLFLDWEIGAVNGTTGANSSSTVKMRCGYCDYQALATEGFDEFTVSLDSGYKYYIVFINANKTEVVYSPTPSWTTASARAFKISDYPNAKYFRIMFQRTDNTIQTGDEAHIRVLTDGGYSDFYNKTNANIIEINDNQILFYPELESGVYDTTTGEKITGTAGVHYRFKNLIPIEEIYTKDLQPASGYMIYAAEFSYANDTYTFVRTKIIQSSGKVSSAFERGIVALGITILKNDYTRSTAAQIKEAFPLRQLKSWWVENQPVISEHIANDIIVFFGKGEYPTISDLNANSISVTFSDKNLIVIDTAGTKNFTPSEIMAAAALYQGVTVDTENRIISGIELKFVYDLESRTIKFYNAYNKMGMYEINLLTHMYTSHNSGIIYDWNVDKLTKQNKSSIDTMWPIVFSVIPSYFETQVETAIGNYRSDLESAGRTGDSFIFITDVHWEGNWKHSPALLRYLVEKADVDMIICGGDLIDGSETYTDRSANYLRASVDAFRESGVPVLVAKGNHDRNSAYNTWSSDVYFSENKYFALAQKPNALNGCVYGGDCYFYYDKVSTKTRYIVLDSGVNNGSPEYAITSAEISWMGSVIDATPADYHIIVIVHSLGTYRSISDPVVPGTNDFVYSASATSMLNALDAKLTDHMIEAVFFGHTHYDANYETAGGIPLISTNSDAKWQYYGMTNPVDGTIDAQCFDVVTIDYQADDNGKKHIYMRRVGRGSDRTIEY